MSTITVTARRSVAAEPGARISYRLRATRRHIRPTPAEIVVSAGGRVLEERTEAASQWVIWRVTPEGTARRHRAGDDPAPSPARPDHPTQDEG